MDSSEDLYRQWKDAGDERAFRALHARHDEHLRARVRRIVPEAGLAVVDDLAQETWFRVVRTESYDGERALQPWLLAIAARVCADYLTRLGRWRALVAAGLDAGPEPGSGEAAALVATHDVAGDVAGDAELREALEAAARELGALPDAEREVVRLRLGAGLLFREIGERVGCSVDAAERRFGAALARLRRRLKGHEQNTGADDAPIRRTAP